MGRVSKFIKVLIICLITVLLISSRNAFASNNEVQLKKIINNENPIYTIKAYAQDDIISMWETIPVEFRSNAAIVIQNDDINKNNSKIMEFYSKQIKKIEEYNRSGEGIKTPIYYFLQALNGETRQSQQISIEYWENIIAETNSKYFLGLNAAELYNSAEWYDGDQDGNHSYYLSELIQLCSKNGMYFLWMDTNRDQDNSIPMINRWLENRKHDGTSKVYPVGSMSPKNNLLDTMKSNSKNIILLNKESFGHPATDSLFYGLWLAGYCDNWGVSSDWWHWGLHNNGGGQSWENISKYPDSKTAQSLVRVTNYGATVFSNEAGWFNNSITDPSKPLDDPTLTSSRIATEQYAILPFFERILNGKINIPTKEELGREIKVIADGVEAWEGIYMEDGTNHSRIDGDIFPYTGRYGIIPIIPKNIHIDNLEGLQRVAPNSEVISEKVGKEYYDNKYPQEYIESNTYLNRSNETWWWFGYKEWDGTLYMKDQVWASKFKPNNMNINWLNVESQGHVYGVFTEKENNSINLYINNYQIDKNDTSTAELPAGGSNWWNLRGPSDFYWREYSDKNAYTPQFGLRNWIWSNLGLQVNENGSPILQGDNVLTNGGILKDRNDNVMRTTTISVKTSERPTIIYNNKENQTTLDRPYTVSEEWDQETEIFKATIVHNGQVDLDIVAYGISTKPEEVSNVALGKNVTMDDNASVTTGEGPRPLTLITDGNKTAERYSDVKKGFRWIQTDLEKEYNINKVNLWRYYTDNRQYSKTIVLLSNDPNFSNEDDTFVLWNSCNDPSSVMWPNDTPEWLKSINGIDGDYNEDSSGKEFSVRDKNLGIDSYVARYVRVYSMSNVGENGDNHFVELEVWGN